MANFPLLSTGAVAQYPLTRGTGFAVEAILFLDGTGQRCVTSSKKLRSWQVALSQLDEVELQRIESFFDGVQGEFWIVYVCRPIHRRKRAQLPAKQSFGNHAV